MCRRLGGLVLKVELEKVREFHAAHKVFFHPEGKMLAIYHLSLLPERFLVQHCEIESGKLVYSFDLSTSISCRRNRYAPAKICFRPDYKTLMVGCRGCGTGEPMPGRIRLMDAMSGKPLKTIMGHSSDVSSMDVSPDGRYLVTGSSSGEMKVWDLDSYKMVTTLEGYGESVLALAFSPDGSVVASGSTYRDPEIILWETSSWTRKLEFKFGWSVSSLGFSSDGRVLAVGGGLPFMEISSARLFVFDAEKGNMIRSLINRDNAAHKHQCVESVSFHPSGALLASGSNDHFVRLWDLESGESVKEVDVREYVSDVAFSPDGSYLACALASVPSGKTFLWKVSVV